jgi:hypothetical protein
MMKIGNIIRKVLREQEENLSELPPTDDFFDNDWNLALRFMNRYPNKKFYYPSDLDLRRTDIKSLGNLVRVDGNLYLSESDIKSLGNLERVDGYLNLYGCENLQSLGNLEYVGGFLSLGYTPLSKKYTIEEIRNMVEVVGKVYL